jgi:photosystem II stability/assembly factor-like uncharacterized protein
MRFQRVLFVLVSLVGIGLSAANGWAQTQTGPLRFRPHAPRPVASSVDKPQVHEPPPYSPSITSMKLLSPTTGWAATDTVLFWTGDEGAHWKDITPPQSEDPKPRGDSKCNVPVNCDASTLTYLFQDHTRHLASVFFLDSSAGWVLVAHNQHSLMDASPNSESDWQFDVSSTVDAGGTWSTFHVSSPVLSSPDYAPPSGGGWITFADSLHGWLNLNITSGSAFNFGALLTTADGGRTWMPLKSPGLSGQVLLLNENDGWLASSPGDELYATHNAGSTWQKISLQAPKEIAPATYPTYDLPAFKDRLNGFVAVTYSGPEGAKSAAVLFTTQDGGRTWKPDRMLTNLEGGSIGQKVASGVADSTWITAVAPGGAPAVKTLLSNDIVLAETNASTRYLSGTRISFVTPTTGWVACASGLLLTTDGGATWATITPGSRGGASSPKASIDESEERNTTTPLPKSEAAPATGLPSAGISQHVGFDQKFVFSVGTMQTWRNSSPYYDVGFYLNGGLSHPTDPTLSASWIAQVSAQGWGLIPIWSGLQAPCACYGGGTYPNCSPFPHTFSSTPATAQAQGQTEAQNAIASDKALGLDGTIVYVDIEQYASSYCGAAVQAFVSGWDQEIANIGFAEGVYGSPINAATDWIKAQPPPDEVWVAATSYGATVWGFAAFGLNDSPNWANYQRIHQYQGNVNQTWGGVGGSNLIDVDIEDGLIAAGNGVKSYTFTAFSIDYPGVPAWGYTYFSGINNGINNSTTSGLTLGGTYLDSNSMAMD